MGNTIERSIELRHAGVVHKFLKRNPSFLRERPDLRAPAVRAFFSSHGGLTAYAGTVELTQTDLYRLLDLVKRGVLEMADFEADIPRKDHRILLIMCARSPGWATADEVVAAAKTHDLLRKNTDGLRQLRVDISNERPVTDFEKDAARALAADPGLRDGIERALLAESVMTA